MLPEQKIKVFGESILAYLENCLSAVREGKFSEAIKSIENLEKCRENMKPCVDELKKDIKLKADIAKRRV